MASKIALPLAALKAKVVVDACLRIVLVAFAFFQGPVWSANQEPEVANPPDLTGLSIESLMEMNVTSVTKSLTKLKHVPAAITVLSSEDIRHSGATTIPEALRGVPGLNVSRIDGNKWAVSARGFNGQYANKLLVLMDGRSLYTPMFSGVWWDQEDVLMEDIERIEVIRGSGASLWGANAVNGVINIITKKAKNTQGGLLSGQGGNQRQGGGLRYGVALSDTAYLKVYGRHSEYGETRLIGSNGLAGDDGRLSKLGIRLDKDFSKADKLTLQGDVYSGFSGGAMQSFPNLAQQNVPVLAPPYARPLSTDVDVSGHYVLGRWEHQLNKDSSTLLRLYWNSNERKSAAVGNAYQIDTVDVDFQNNFRLNGHHNAVWGAGVRVNSNSTQNSLILGWTPAHRQDEIYSLFAQDEISLVPNRWKLTLGSKFEHNPVTQFEWQPTARLSWTPAQAHAFWASVSRSVRTPSWAEQDINYAAQVIPPVGGGYASPYNPATLLLVRSNKNSESEKMLAYEMGWRGELSPKLSADVALYYYDYDDAFSFAPAALDFSHLAAGYLLQAVNYSNFGAVQIYGGEASLDWRVSEVWKLRASYSHAQQQFKVVGQAPVGTTALYENGYPTHQVLLGSMLQLTPQLHFDLNWRFVDKQNKDLNAAPAYHELDARLAWELRKGLELALIGRSLLNNQHIEQGSQLFPVATAVQREVYATLRWDF